VVGIGFGADAFGTKRQARAGQGTWRFPII